MKTKTLIFLLISFATYVNGQQNADIYVFNNGQDTIYFSEIGQIDYEITNIPVDNDQRIDTNLIDKSTLALRPLNYDSLLIFDSLQVDGKGSKEIIFCRKINNSESVHGGTYDGIASYSLEKTEIWNIDTKELYWSGVIFYNSSSPGYYNRSTRVMFKYDFKIDSFGKIKIIKELAQIIHNDADGQKSVSEIIPDLKAGFYQFRNGEYRWGNKH